MILGLDISTSKIGIAILDGEQNIVFSDVIKYKTNIELEDKAQQLEDFLIEIKNKHNIEYIIIEAPFVAIFGGGGSAQTSAILNIFNGMCRYVVQKVFGKKSILIDVRTARKNVGIKIPNKMKGKDKKKFVIEFIEQKYPNTFLTTKTKHGNYGVGEDDRADSIVLALGFLNGRTTT